MRMPWQYDMKEWEVKLEDNLLDIMDKTKLSQDRLMSIVEILKEYEVLEG